ncbi:MAG: hypothetical protein IJN09_07550, partial [Oscillospiraceae bacterium]|nr:hypothetical protein [Oscillospiraceae bacterium]
MKMKKIIAILLTLIMVIAMLPTAFAEGEEVVWDPHYKFYYPSLGLSAAKDLDSVDTYTFDKTKSRGVWSWVADYKIDRSYLDSQIQFYETASFDDNALILKGELDKPGTYTPKILYDTKWFTGKVSMYVVPASYADSKWNM